MAIKRTYVCDRCKAQFDEADFESKPLSERRPIYHVTYHAELGVGRGAIEFVVDICRPCRDGLSDTIRTYLKN